MNSSFGEQLVEDLAAVIAAQREGDQKTTPDGTPWERVRPWLERALVNADDLRIYERALQQAGGGRFHYQDELPQEIFEQIVEAGLGRIEPEWLARIALDPVWIRMLSDEVSRRFPEAWWEAMNRDGQRLRVALAAPQVIVLRREREVADGSEDVLRAAASPSCAPEDAAGDIRLANEDGWELWASPHPRAGCTTLRFVGRQPPRPIVLRAADREVAQIELLDEHGYLVVATADVETVLTEQAELTIEPASTPK
jgi:hypothetical protein